MKVLPQPEFQKCSHVAFAVVPIIPVKQQPQYLVTAHQPQQINDEASTPTLGSTRADRQPESIANQFGLVVVEPSDTSDGLIYAQVRLFIFGIIIKIFSFKTTGSISFMKSTLQSKTAEPGTFVYFDAVKSLSGQQHEKCSWKALSVTIVGNLSCVESDMAPNRFSTNLDNCLTVTATAIVCRVSHSNSSAWLWNDLIGRIFVNNHHYVEDLHAFDVVTVKAQFTAAFEGMMKCFKDVLKFNFRCALECHICSNRT